MMSLREKIWLGIGIFFTLSNFLAFFATGDILNGIVGLFCGVMAALFYNSLRKREEVCE